jgi:multiple antibiotic resistance protein
MDSWFADLLRALIPLFVIINPVGAVPLFLSMTETVGKDRRPRTAWIAAVTCTATLLLTAIAGKALFDFFGITIHGFRIAGGILLFIYAMDMIQFRPSRMKSTEEEVEHGANADEVGIIPLGIPMLAGPGAIATVLILRLQGPPGIEGWSSLFTAIGLMGIATWLTLHLAARAQRWLTPVTLGIIVRLEALLLGGIAVEMVIAGIRGAIHGAG